MRIGDKIIKNSGDDVHQGMLFRKHCDIHYKGPANGQ
jgi:hypothetical protein